jgi:hypothetical protein
MWYWKRSIHFLMSHCDTNFRDYKRGNGKCAIAEGKDREVDIVRRQQKPWINQLTDTKVFLCLSYFKIGLQKYLKEPSHQFISA